jgi:hypothetical protein
MFFTLCACSYDSITYLKWRGMTTAGLRGVTEAAPCA